MMMGRIAVVGLIILAGCAAPKGKAPVETRAISASQVNAKKAPAATPSSTAAAHASNESADPVPAGFYRVRRGDTLISISLEHGVDWRDLASWNDISNPNVIEVGRLLRILPARASAPPPEVAAIPSSTSVTPTQGAAQTAPLASTGGPQVRPIEASPRPSVPSAEGSSGQAPGESLASAAPTPSPSAPPTAGGPWVWPANGQVITGFSEGGSKGVAIAGAQGESIFAAESGRVIYSGNGLRGYGNLVIVKHDQEFTTAYAHNRAILVKEGQMVRRGQKIAELGMSDADRPMLHFEVRKGGKPIDPMGLLPPR